METFSLPLESCQESQAHSVAVSQFEDRTEQRRLLNPEPDRSWRVRSPILTASGLEAYQDFYSARKGAFEAFSFTNPDDGNMYTVRFAGEMKINREGGTFQAEAVFVTTGA